MDSFSAHLTDDVNENLDNNSCKSIIIPGSCTSKVQPLDVSVNKPFKQILKNKWSPVCEEQGRRFDCINFNEDQDPNSLEGRIG